MGSLVLITGGAGFIGSHLADELLARGYRVRLLDSLVPQVHGLARTRPAYLTGDAELVVGDVRHPDIVRRALEGASAVFHFAAAVGVGQSMYQVHHYTDVNNVGTAVLLEALVDARLERLVVASSMSIYGEGLYQRADGTRIEGRPRPRQRLREALWDLADDRGQALVPVPTPEWKRPELASVYALSKFDQERLCLLMGDAYHIPTVALRFFNVYGTRQALSNPYTGVLAIFASRLLNGKPPRIFEDGAQRRDFVSVRDVVRACVLALEHPHASGQVFNVGSGQHYSVRDIAARVAAALGHDTVVPDITAQYRVGDVRHCFADITKAREVLGYVPQVTLEEGLRELAEWLASQVADDRVADANAELAARGLTV